LKDQPVELGTLNIGYCGAAASRLDYDELFPVFARRRTFMRFAIPLAGGRLCAHFGHCEQFALVDVSEADRRAAQTTLVTPPPHQPGLLPSWLQQQDVDTVIVSGIGQRAQQLFAQSGIRVIVGAPADTPEKLVSAYLAGALRSGPNVCDH
jgi:ATP-binding protein involved in chromosome partitioning